MTPPPVRTAQPNSGTPSNRDAENSAAAARPQNRAGGEQLDHADGMGGAGGKSLALGGSPPSDPHLGGESESTLNERQRRFLDRAAAILAEQRGMGPRTQTLLTVTARELGLRDDEAALALRSLAGGISPGPAVPTPPGVPSPEPQGGGSQSSTTVVDSADSPLAPPVLKGAGRSVEAPAPPARKRPDEEFSKWVQSQLGRLTGKVLTPELQTALIKKGQEHFKLSEVFARDLVRELSETMGVSIQQRADALDDSRGSETVGQVGAGESRDPRVAEFLIRAGSILAVHRGLNAKSRVLLSAVAREVGFADDELAVAFRSLEGSRPAESAAESADKRRLPPFLHTLREQLTKLPHGVVTFSVQESIVEQAELRFGLGGETARTALRQVIGELKLKVIAEAEAVRHLEGLVAEAMGESLHIAPNLVPRLIAEGQRWGLVRERVEEIIHSRSKANYRQQYATERVSKLALWGAVLACLIVVGFFGWTLVESRFFPDDSPAAATNVNSLESVASTAMSLGSGAGVADSVPATAAGGSVATDTSWWSPLMLVAAREARTKLGFSLELLNELAAADKSQRTAAYRKAVPLLYDPGTEASTRLVLEQILAEAYAHEPNDAAAEALGRAILARIPGPAAQLSEDPQEYPRIFQALRLALACAAASQKAEPRVLQMSSLISESLGVKLDPGLKPRDQRTHCNHALAEHLFRLLIAAASLQPKVAVTLQPLITREAKDYLEPEELEALQTEFIVALLGTDESSWREFRGVLGSAIRSPDTLLVAKLIDLFEMVKDDELAAFLEGLLVERAELRTTVSQRAELARELRTALGVSVTRTTEGRNRRFQQLANQQLNSLKNPAGSPTDLLTETMRLAYITTLGAALARNELGDAVFDELEKEGVPVSSKEESDTRSATSKVADADWSLLESIDRDLQIMGSQGSAGRYARIEALSRAAERLPDIRPAQAQMLAAYLLMNKPQNEHQAILKYVPILVRWPQLRLALADGLGASKLTREQLSGLLGQVLGRPVSPESIAAGPDAIRAALLAEVLTKLNQAADTTGTSTSVAELDRARDKITHYYRKQVELAGATAEETAELKSVAAALHVLIQRQSERLATLTLKPDEQRRLTMIPYELNAITYVASDDLHAAVLLQRLYIEQLAISLRTTTPARANDLANLLQRLAKEDRESTNILTQLRDGQATIVRLQQWQLEAR